MPRKSGDDLGFILCDRERFEGASWKQPSCRRHKYGCLCKRGLQKHKAHEGAREKGARSTGTGCLPLSHCTVSGEAGSALSAHQQHRRNGAATVKVSGVVHSAALCRVAEACSGADCSESPALWEDVTSALGAE